MIEGIEHFLLNSDKILEKSIRQANSKLQASLSLQIGSAGIDLSWTLPRMAYFSKEVTTLSQKKEFCSFGLQIAPLIIEQKLLEDAEKTLYLTNKFCNVLGKEAAYLLQMNFCDLQILKENYQEALKYAKKGLLIIEKQVHSDISNGKVE